MEPAIAIIGGGITGLAAAHELARLGREAGRPLRTLLFESRPRLGGLLETECLEGYRVEWAANGWLGSARAATELAMELGLESEVCPAAPAAARRFIYRGGRLHELSGSPIAMMSSPLLSPLGRLRILGEPFVKAKRDGVDESVEAFAARRIGPEAARVMVSAAVCGIFAGDSRVLSLRAAFPRMVEMEEQFGSLVRALISLKRAHGSAVTPTGPRGSLLSFRDGMATWARQLGAELGDAASTGTRVTGIEPQGAGYRLWLDGAGGERSVDASAVIFAAGSGPTADLLAPLAPVAATGIRDIPSCNLAVVALTFGPDSFRGPSDGYGFLVPRGEDLQILGALWDSNLFPGRAPDGHTLVRVMIGGALYPEKLDLDDAALTRLALDALTRGAGLRNPPGRTWIRRHIPAIPQYNLGHKDKVAAIEAEVSRRKGLVLAGNPYRGVAVGGCIEDARRAAREVMATLGIEPAVKAP